MNYPRKKFIATTFWLLAGAKGSVYFLQFERFNSFFLLRTN